MSDATLDPTFHRSAREAAAEDQLPPALKPFGAVPPLVTDISLSVGGPQMVETSRDGCYR